MYIRMHGRKIYEYASQKMYLLQSKETMDNAEIGIEY